MSRDVRPLEIQYYPVTQTTVKEVAVEFKKPTFVIPGLSCAVVLSGCATIVNDANISLAFSFSDGSSGHCTFRNKRGAWESDIPTTAVYIRRSDDALIYDCQTKDGRKVTGSVRSEIEGEKLGASVLFLDFGITDAITDKHRTYQANITIPVPPKNGEKSPIKQNAE